VPIAEVGRSLLAVCKRPANHNLLSNPTHGRKRPSEFRLQCVLAEYTLGFDWKGSRNLTLFYLVPNPPSTIEQMGQQTMRLL
jgi:hypothetical protein